MELVDELRRIAAKLEKDDPAGFKATDLGATWPDSALVLYAAGEIERLKADDVYPTIMRDVVFADVVIPDSQPGSRR